MKKALKQLKKLPGAAGALLEINADPLIVTDTDGQIIDANSAWVRLCGIEADELTDTDLFELFTDAQKAKKACKDIFLEGHVKNVQLSVHHKKGKLTDVLMEGSAFEDEQGNVAGAIIRLNDQRQQKKSDEQTAYLAAIVTSSDDAIISKSPEGIIQTWNKGAEKTFGFSAEEAVGKHISIIVPPYLRDEEEKILERIKHGSHSGQQEMIRKRKDGVTIHVSAAYSPIRDANGEITGISTVERDITGQKKFENELIEARKNAEQATHTAEEAVKSKQQFLSTMSHEIRTPLNAIIGFTNVVLKTDLTAKQKEYLDAIKISGDALIILINDILDLAKVDAGKMTFEQKNFKMDQATASMLRLFDTKAKEKNIELIREYDEQIPETVIGDPARLQQVVLNLMSNAVKFTDSGKIVFGVRLIAEESEKIMLEFSVTDTGIGIEEDKLESIFENFQQASGETSRKYGGTGLGLAIVKKLVEAQNGRVWVKSTPGVGSGFYFTLGFKKVKEEGVVKTEKEKKSVLVKTERKNMNGGKILVAEDVTLNQLLVKTLLEEFGFGVDIAANGKIATEKMEKGKYDLILMDLQMPEMNGFEATEYIRSTLKSDIPIIALTADVTTVDVEKCREAGMDDYLAKPINDKLLYSKIRKYLKEEEPMAEKPVAEHTHHVSKSLTNLDYLKQYTRGSEETIREMIGIYLKETPQLINTMKQSIDGMDWDALARAAHSLIPSFTVMGINKEYEDMTKKVQEYAKKREKAEEISDLVNNIEKACKRACAELEESLKQKEFKS